MKESEKPNRNTKTSGRPENIKAETAKTARKPPKKITETYLHNAGLYYLQRFAASSEQFRKVMQRKISSSCRHHTDQNIEQCYAWLETLISRFQENGLLNDAGYARGMVYSLRRRGLSEQAILSKLQQRGLSTTEIKAALDAYYDENKTERKKAEFQAALNLARKKRVGPYATAPFDHKRMLSAFARAGFSFDLAQRILEMRPEELEAALASDGRDE